MLPIRKRQLTWLLRAIPAFLWPFKIWLIKKSLKSVGKRFRFGPNCSFSDPRLISIGNHVFFGDGSIIGCTVPVTIGDHVMFGPQVMIRGGDHNFSEVGVPMAKSSTLGKNIPVTLENDIWVGARATILKGVTVGEGAVIGAGSLVNRSILPYTINVGVPCKPVRSRFTAEQLAQHLKEVKSNYSFQEINEMYASSGVSFNAQ